MTRHINCHKCGLYLGEIRDATLRKGTKHVCSDCAAPAASVPDFLQGILNGQYRKTKTTH
jgi:hypothetical protein